MNNYIIKLKSGTFVPGLGLVSIPTYISRDNRGGGWRLSHVKFPDAEIHYFSDYAWGNTGNALKAAVAALKHEQEQLLIGRPLLTEELTSKQEKLGEVGICHYTTLQRGMEVHYFGVSDVSNQMSLNVYIGTLNTWTDNWDKAFQRAKDLRFQCEHEYNVRNYWKSLDKLPKPYTPKRRKLRAATSA